MARTNNPSTSAVRHGGHCLIEALATQGVERVFCVPGESFLAALDALHDTSIQTIVARHEGGASMMAEAHGKLTGAPGIAFVTRGPGASNAAAGVHVAFQDSTPLILFIGQVASDQRDREAFQEVDYRAMFAPLAKWVAEVDQVARLPEYVSRAFHVAMAGRPGPVVLALPQDMLSAPTDAQPVARAQVPGMQASKADIHAVVSRLVTAERPLIIAGGSRWSAAAAQALGQFAETTGIPVGTSFRCQDFIDNRHPMYMGDVGIGINPALAERVRSADLILALGARLGEITTSGYTLLVPPVPAQRLIHVHPDANEIGRVYLPELGVVASGGEFIEQLAAAASGSIEAPANIQAGRRAWLDAARADYTAWQQPQATPGDLQMEQIIGHLNQVLPDDAIVTNGAGNYAAWLHRYYCYRHWRTQLAPTSGSMGYGLPAAIAASLVAPDREVICLAGDGCFQMVMQEFGTACQYGAQLIVLVVNNGHYGTIRMHQEHTYPGRPSGTLMRNPDFSALAQAYGAFGATVSNNDEFPAALRAARTAQSPAILDLKVSPKALSPRLVLSE